MKNKHTSGSWEIEQSRLEGESFEIVANETGYIARVYGVEDSPCLDEEAFDLEIETVANANLITSAPKLLDVLEELIDIIEYGEGLDSFTLQPAKLAIAKAKGGQNAPTK